MEPRPPDTGGLFVALDPPQACAQAAKLREAAHDGRIMARAEV